MGNSYLTNIHTRKNITEMWLFIICTCQNMYSKKTCPVLRSINDEKNNSNKKKHKILPIPDPSRCIIPSNFLNGVLK